jgi:predicted helicase
MSKLLITKYHNQLHEILSAGGTRNETSITFAFATLLRAYAEKKNLLLVEQKEAKGRGANRVVPDGTIKYFGGVDVGYWEAKDSKDNLNDEIDFKLNVKGYPDKNIVFEDTQTAVLIQEGAEVMRVAMREWNLLDDLLDRFISYEPGEVREFNRALEHFKEDVPSIVEGLRGLMAEAADTNKAFRDKRDEFLLIAQTEINPEITPEDIREMIIQHVLTEDIFTNVFADAEFHRSNNIARELENVIETFMTREVRKNYLKSIENYYKTIRDAASGITDNHEKQKFLKTVYENFYKVYNPKGADKLGVVYTPNEIVRFMIDSTDWLLDKHFNKTLSDKGVDILDPATGTGTFVAELIDRINIHDLEYKYEHELHANEVAILPYYIANLNIEYTYQQRKGTYKEFKNICFVDTLDNTDALDYSGKQLLLGGISSENAERIKKQNEKKISVIIGNPPYNANQANFNDFNKNREYKEIDKRVKDTYVKFSTAQKTKVYDMYARFYRWSMDRLDENGIIAFVTNRSFIDSRTFDGFRKVIEDEFDVAYIVDTRSDVRANPKIAGTSHNVFGIQTGVTIMFLIKKQAEDKRRKYKCKIYYAALDDFWRKEEKLNWLVENPISKIEFDRIEPDEKHNWINQTDNDWESLIPLRIKGSDEIEGQIFINSSLGMSTNRDEWIYDNQVENLQNKIEYLLNEINQYIIQKGNFEEFEPKIKWSRDLRSKVGTLSKKLKFEPKKIAKTSYRPFTNYYSYLDKFVIDRYTDQHINFNGKQTKSENHFINYTDSNSGKPFMVLSTKSIADLHFVGAGAGTMILPLYTFDSENQKHENITDWSLAQFQGHYNNLKITKEDIFYYVYAVLHAPAYRKKYEQNLKREFPRLPFYDDFKRWRDWGESLMDLHINYETAEPFALERNDLKPKPTQASFLAGDAQEAFIAKATPKLRADRENGTILIDSHTTLTSIPPQAWEYKLGNRSALEWILDQYKEKKPSDATIAERFNTYKFSDYKEQVIDLIKRVATVSVRTMEIVNQMPQE